MAFGTKDEFDAKRALLTQELRDWYDSETRPIDFDEDEDVGGEAGTILETCPPIDSKRVLDARCVTQSVLGMGLPGKIIRRGGYQDVDQMIDDLIPKLQKLFTGEMAFPKEKERRGPREGAGMSARSESPVGAE